MLGRVSVVILSILAISLKNHIFILAFGNINRGGHPTEIALQRDQ